jgi:hypothetical protein
MLTFKQYLFEDENEHPRNWRIVKVHKDDTTFGKTRWDIRDKKGEGDVIDSYDSRAVAKNLLSKWRQGHCEKCRTEKIKEETSLEEAVKLNSKVKIHAPGKDYHDKIGRVGEIRHGLYKGAPKTYTIDYEGKSIQLSKNNIKLHKESIEEANEDI